MKETWRQHDSQVDAGVVEGMKQHKGSVFRYAPLMVFKNVAGHFQSYRFHMIQV